MSHSSLQSMAGVTVLAGLGALLAACSGPAGSAHALPPAATMSTLTSGIGDAHRLKFTTLDDDADLTFNQLLGINDNGEIAGYFGNGGSGHPNKGYTIVAPYGQGNYTNENYPGSAQTQVTGLNNSGDTCGFWVDANGNNFGFIEWNGVFTTYKNPHTGKGTVNQLLGINDGGIAVGFYTDANGVNHGYSLNQATGKFTAIVPPNGSNVIAAGINNAGDVTGFETTGSGNVDGWLRKAKKFTSFSFPGSNNTSPLGDQQERRDRRRLRRQRQRDARLHADDAADRREVQVDRRSARQGNDDDQRAQRQGRARRVLRRRRRQHGRLPGPVVLRGQRN